MLKKGNKNMFKKKHYIITIFSIILITLISSISVGAVPSPSKQEEPLLIVNHNTGGTGSKQRVKSKKDGFRYKITANAKQNFTFSKWKIEGKYKIISGNLKGKIMIIDLITDCEATPYFVRTDGKKVTKVKINTSSISPKTGPPEFENISGIVAIIFCLLFFGMIFYTFFLKKNFTKIEKKEK